MPGTPPHRQKNGGPEAAAVAEMFTGYAPYDPLGQVNPVRPKPDQSVISNRTDQLRVDILPLDLVENIQ